MKSEYKNRSNYRAQVIGLQTIQTILKIEVILKQSKFSVIYLYLLSFYYKHEYFRTEILYLLNILVKFCQPRISVERKDI